MFCPKCGTNNADDARFCASCGGELTAAPVTEAGPVNVETPEAVSPPVTQEAHKKDILASVRPLLEKVAPFVQKNKLFVVGGLGILACVICIALLVTIFGGGSGYSEVKHSIDVTIVDDEIVFTYDNKKAVKTGVEADDYSTQESIDGSVVALLTDNYELYIIKNNKMVKVEEGVANYVLSADGTGLAYITREDDEDNVLYLYNVKNKKAKTVSKNVYGSTMALSPNGDSVCYYDRKEDDDESSLMYFKGSKSTKVTSKEVSLIALSNNGKYIYTYGRDDEDIGYLYSYNTKGDSKKIGKFSGYSVYLNEDHTQVMYTYEGKSFISTKGKEGVKVSSSEASPVIPRNAAYYYNRYAFTIGTDNLYNKVYQCSAENGYNVWYIRKNTDKSVKLVGGVRSVTLSEDGKNVFYMDEDELKVLIVSKGDNAADKAKVLAEDIDDYVVTSNGKKVYYSCDDGVFCVNAKNGKGKKTVTTEEIDSYLYINAKDVVYYIFEGDAYASKNGSKGKVVVSDAEGLEASRNGIVYVYTEDALYTTKGAKKPTKVLERD